MITLLLSPNPIVKEEEPKPVEKKPEPKPVEKKAEAKPVEEKKVVKVEKEEMQSSKKRPGSPRPKKGKTIDRYVLLLSLSLML